MVYEVEIIGEYFADILVDNKVIVEIKAAKSLAIENEAQLLNYLKTTEIEVGLLLNSGPKLDFKRRFLIMRENSICIYLWKSVSYLF